MQGLPVLSLTGSRQLVPRGCKRRATRWQQGTWIHPVCVTRDASWWRAEVNGCIRSCAVLGTSHLCPSNPAAPPARPDADAECQQYLTGRWAFQVSGSGMLRDASNTHGRADEGQVDSPAGLQLHLRCRAVIGASTVHDGPETGPGPC